MRRVTDGRGRGITLLTMRVVAAGTLVLLLGAGCQTDHDALTQRDPGRPGAGDGSAGEDGGNAGTNQAARGGAANAGATGVAGPTEPEGPRVLTLLHAVVDGGRIWFCFSRVDGGMVRPAADSPLPATGLSYGEIVSTGSLTDLDLAADSIQPWVIEGDLSELEGLNCRQALDLAASYARAWPPRAGGGAGGLGGESASATGAAGEAGVGGAEAGAGNVGGGAGGTDGVAGAGGTDGAAGAAGADGAAGAAGAAGTAGAAGAGVELYPPPPLQALPLPVIPAGTLVAERSFLLAARGCMGGGTLHSADWEEEVCGAGYSPTSPTLAPVLVMLSRVTADDAVGVQVVNATSDRRSLDVRSVGPSASQSLARDVAPGAIKPRSPNLDCAAAEYGDPVADAVLEVVENDGSTVRHSQTWGSALASSDLTALSDGHTFAVVVAGPSLGIQPGTWHHGSNLTVIETERTDP